MTELERELLKLYDLRVVKLREERELSELVDHANKEIRLLTMWFAGEEVPDLTYSLNDDERLMWNARLKKILYARHGVIRIIDAVEKETIIRMRSELQHLVRIAKEKFLEEEE